MEWWSKIRKGWIKVARLLGIRKTGLLKLRHDVRTCEYEDVHVLWEMLKRNDTGLARSAAGGKTNCFFEYCWMGKACSSSLPSGRIITLPIAFANSQLLCCVC